MGSIENHIDDIRDRLPHRSADEKRIDELKLTLIPNLITQVEHLRTMLNAWGASINDYQSYMENLNNLNDQLARAQIELDTLERVVRHSKLN